MKKSPDTRTVVVFKIIGYATALLTLLFGLSRIWDATSGYYGRKAQVRQLLALGEVQRARGDYRAAWETFEKAAAVQSSADVAHHQEDLAMEWLRQVRAPDGQTYTDVVNMLSPVLTRGVTQSGGTRKADLLAHLGWGDYIRFRENEQQRRPDTYFDDALKVDPTNVFAHTFEGFWIIWNRGPVSEASAHFRSAVDSKRERRFVRDFQFVALFWYGGMDQAAELLRVAADMVRNAEPIPRGIQERIFSHTYWSSRQDESMREKYIQAVEIQDHLKMFQTLYGPGADSSLYGGDEILRDFWLATLFERAGKTSDALNGYRQVKTQFEATRPYREDYIQIAEDAIRRLSTASRVR